MAWNEKSVFDERVAFIDEWLRRESSIAELCRRFGVSEKTGHKMIGRFKAEGREGLHDRRRAPHRHPNAVAEETAAAVLAVATGTRAGGRRRSAAARSYSSARRSPASVRLIESEDGYWIVVGGIAAGQLPGPRSEITPIRKVL